MNNNNNQLQQKERQNALLQKDITDTVMTRLTGLQKEGVVLPPNYNAQNALKSAFFALTNSSNGNLLEKCTSDSIAQALLDMVMQGLNPTKKQCYFIPYGNVCQMTPSYFGVQKILKSLPEVVKSRATVIYEGDIFEYKIIDAEKFLVRHDSCIENQDKEIRGAYAVITETDGAKPITVMSRKELLDAWGMSPSYGKSKTHTKFPQEMAQRTVLKRAAKPYVNTSDDSILVESINRSIESEEDSRIDKTNAIDVEIKEQANSQEFVEEDVPQVPCANYQPEPQQAWPQGQQASTQAPQAVVQQTPTTESQSQECIWNL